MGQKKVQLATKKGIWGTNGFGTLFLLLTTPIFDVRMNETSFFLQYHGGLRARKLGQAPMLLVFLTPRRRYHLTRTFLL